MSESQMVKRKPGRPQKFNTQELQSIYTAFSTYIEETADPTIVGFVAQFAPIDNRYINRELISDRPEFSPLTKQCHAKQEAFLLTQYKNPAMAIFRLKQPVFGYTDKREVESKSLNVDVQVKPELAQGFMDYLKQSTSVKPD